MIELLYVFTSTDLNPTFNNKNKPNSHKPSLNNTNLDLKTLGMQSIFSEKVCGIYFTLECIIFIYLFIYSRTSVHTFFFLLKVSHMFLVCVSFPSYCCCSVCAFMFVADLNPKIKVSLPFPPLHSDLCSLPAGGR